MAVAAGLASAGMMALLKQTCRIRALMATLVFASCSMTALTAQTDCTCEVTNSKNDHEVVSGTCGEENICFVVSMERLSLPDGTDCYAPPDCTGKDQCTYANFKVTITTATCMPECLQSGSTVTAQYKKEGESWTTTLPSNMGGSSTLGAGTTEEYLLTPDGISRSCGTSVGKNELRFQDANSQTRIAVSVSYGCSQCNVAVVDPPGGG